MTHSSAPPLEEAEKLEFFKNLQDLEIARFLSLVAIKTALVPFIRLAVLKSARLFKKQELTHILSRCEEGEFLEPLFVKILAQTKTALPLPTAEMPKTEIDVLMKNLFLSVFQFIFRFPVEILPDDVLSRDVREFVDSKIWKTEIEKEFEKMCKIVIALLSLPDTIGPFARIIAKAREAFGLFLKKTDLSIQEGDEEFYREIFFPKNARNFDFKQDDIVAMIERVARGQ